MKRVPVLMMLVLLAMTSYAQTPALQRYGVKANAQLSSYFVNKGDLPTTLTPKVGVAIGGFATFGLTDKLAVQPELLYSLQGFTYDGDKANQDYRMAYTQHYLKVPVLLWYGITDKLHAEFGPQIGILMSATLRDEEQGEELYNGKVTEVFRKADVALAAGLEYRLSDKIGANVRFAQSITNMFTDGPVIQRPWVLSLGVTYSF